MILGEVLHILREEASAICSSNTALYVLLFTDDSLENTAIYEEIAKKRFGKRGLPNELRAQYCEEASFNNFCDQIETRYLKKIHDTNGIYRKLKALILDCPYLPQQHKKQLLGSCNPDIRFQLARFIAACILCGSYHSSMLQSKEAHNRYGLSLNFMNLDHEEKQFPLQQRIWEAEQRAFLFSHKEGSRFFDLNIIERLLPHGYITKNTFLLRARTTDGEIRPLMDIYKDNPRQDIAVTGEGGIGKTTFLQQLLEEEFWDDNKRPSIYTSGRPVPIFIELKQCPSQIQDWYEEHRQKTNFITRYIGQLLENHRFLDNVSATTLESIEMELQRIPEDGNPQYLLLLDGFNEISVTGKGNTYSCRSMLSNEISIIHNDYANVRIIATSRETQAAYFTSSFQNIYLTGLEENDIREHLELQNFSDTSIGITMAMKPLVKCLKVPLFLCMFCYEHPEDGVRLPETPGEILYNFFHGNSTFYNARKRAADTHTNPLNEWETALTLDFILPYIGWSLERSDTFSISECRLKQCILEALELLEHMVIGNDAAPFEDFQYNPELLSAAHASLTRDKNAAANIISCIFDYLGILYQYMAPEKDIAERRQYSFIHHYFRDYFSAMFDIQLLRMLPYIDPDIFSASAKYTYKHFLNSNFWNQSKKEMISQILMEHHNKPVLHPVTQNWYLPKPTTDEQKVLSNAICFCRTLKPGQPMHYLLHNILSAIIYGRGELSGMDLTNLNFNHCNIFAVPCSKKGTTQTLAAQFDNSIIPDNFLEPDDHVDHIEEYVYNGQHCFTLDGAGVIKCWDILSGCLEYILQSGDPNGASDYSPNGLMKVSPDSRWLAAKAYTFHEGCYHPSLYVFDLEHTEQEPYVLQPPETHTTITSFSFTEDSRHILYLADRYNLYCFEIKSSSLVYSGHYNAFLKYTELYAASVDSDVYAFSGEYDNFDSVDFYPENEEEEPVPYEGEEWYEDAIDDDHWEDSDLPVPCLLLQCKPADSSVVELYSFTGEPGTYPVAKYFSVPNCFLLYNHGTGQLERFSCRSGNHKAETVWEELTLENDNRTPTAIQYCPGHPTECYIIYPRQCYSVDLIARERNGIIMKYDIDALSKLIDNEDEMDELMFYPNAVPNWNRFIVRNSENTYEWDTANDTLRRRYNTALYECRDLIYDRMHQLAILVHQYNGISIFSGNPVHLSNALCYPNPEYYVGSCCYHEATQWLALMFCKSTHEYVEIINLYSGERETIYSTLQPHETLESVQFHPDGKHLLICSGHTCAEYDMVQKQIHTIENAGANELYIDANYTDDKKPQIQIAIVEHYNYEEPSVLPHCDHYSILRTQHRTTYKREWRYYMPELTKDSAAGFLFYSYDIGSGASYTREEYQTYWCTCGFFLHDFPKDDAFDKIRCSRFQGGRELPMEKKFSIRQMIYCKHDFALANQYRTEKNCHNYAYCSDDFSEVIEIFDHKHITYWKHLNTNPTSDTFVYDDGENTSEELGYVFFDTVIPWTSDSLLSCSEQYRMIQLQKENQGKSVEIPYSPGISICGCSLYNVSANQVLLELLQNNGGNL